MIRDPYLASPAPPFVHTPGLDDFLVQYTPLFLEIRQKLHRIPEPGTKEYKTGALLQSYLKAWGIPFEYPVADTGIVALIEGTGASDTPGRVAALRADMDALPLTEPESLSFASEHPGMMHACGHDIHMAIALGCALYFKTIQHTFNGSIKILFQPAEETVGGARRMIAAGCMEHPHVDAVAGLHVAPYLPTGTVETRYGKLYAASDEIHITLHGKSCHGAYPDTGTDALLMAANLVVSLQSLVSRNVSPLDAAVLSLGTIHGGSAHNIVADCVTLTGALRTTDPDTRRRAAEIIKRHVAHVAQAFGGRGEAEILPGYDALINTDHAVDVLAAAFTPLLGKEHILFKPSPGMGVEDFSFFLEQAPGVFYHLGCRPPAQKEAAPLHSPDFRPDESCIPLGIRLQSTLAWALLLDCTDQTIF